MVFLVFICGANGKTELAGFWLTGWAWIYLTCLAKALQEGAESRLKGSFLYRSLSLRSTFYRRIYVVSILISCRKVTLVSRVRDSEIYLPLEITRSLESEVREQWSQILVSI